MKGDVMLIEGVESRVSLKIPESFAGNIGVAFCGDSLRAVNAKRRLESFEKDYVINRVKCREHIQHCN